MKSLLLVLGMFSASAYSADMYKCVIANDIWQTEITFVRNHNQVTEFTVQELVRGVPKGPARTLKAETINDYSKGWTYKLQLEPNFSGIIDDFPGKGTMYVNLIFGQASTGSCLPELVR